MSFEDTFIMDERETLHIRRTARYEAMRPGVLARPSSKVVILRKRSSSLGKNSRPGIHAF